MVEHRLPKPGVAGSIPVSRSSNHKYKAAAQLSMLTLRLFDFAVEFVVPPSSRSLRYRTIVSFQRFVFTGS